MPASRTCSTTTGTPISAARRRSSSSHTTSTSPTDSAPTTLAKEKEQDVADEILVDVSLAYWPLEVVVTEDKNGIPTYELTKWLPYETSSVTVPADFSVGVGRSAQAAAPAEVLVTYRKLAEPAAAAPTDVSATRSSENADEDEEDGDAPEDGEERKCSAVRRSAARNRTHSPNHREKDTGRHGRSR